MAISDRFSRHLNKIRKETGFQLNTSSLEQVRKSFLFNIGDVPDELKVEMYEYFIEQYGENGEDRRTIDELAEKLRAVVELFNFELNDEEALSDDDWDFIKETVSDYALDLDDETLTYIMRFVVERGGFDS